MSFHFLFPHMLLDMTRSQTNSHTTEPKTDTMTASSGSSINTAVVFQAQELFGFIKDEARSLIKNIKDTSTESSVEYRSKSCRM